MIISAIIGGFYTAVFLWSSREKKSVTGDDDAAKKIAGCAHCGICSRAAND